MKDLSKAPGIGGALKKDKQLKKWSGKVISIPGVQQKPVKVNVFKSWKTIKGLRELEESGKRAVTDLQMRMMSTSDPGELQLLQNQIDATQRSRQEAREALKFMKTSKNKRRNALLLAGIKLTGAGAVITKIPFVDRLILNYGHVFVYTTLAISMALIVFAGILVAQFVNGNVLNPVQLGADIATGKCSVDDPSCIGRSWVDHSLKNGTI